MTLWMLCASFVCITVKYSNFLTFDEIIIEK
jgi:hypothetical protein